MVLALSVAWGAKTYYKEFEGSKGIRIGAEGTDLSIPGFIYTVKIKPLAAGAGALELEVSAGTNTKTLTANIDQPCLIDIESRIALIISKADEYRTPLWLSEGKVYTFGRSSKAGKDGAVNDVVIRRGFISGQHFSIEVRGGIVTARDNNSSNGLFLNGEKITKSVLRKGDVLSVYTVRFLYDGDKLRAFNVSDEIAINCENTPVYAHSDGTVTVFEKSPRIKNTIACETIDVPAPPAQVEKPQIDIVSTFLPAAATVLMGIIMAFVLHGAGMLYSLPMTLSGVIISVVNYLNLAHSMSFLRLPRSMVLRSWVSTASARTLFLRPVR